MDIHKSHNWLAWPTDALAFPEGVADQLSSVATMVDRLAVDLAKNSLPRTEARDLVTLRNAMHNLGALGLLGSEVPQERGGTELSITECCRIMEGLGPLGGLAVAFVAHAGLATIPLAIYGEEDVASRYLPRLISGEWIGAYCLTETGSGSDAQAARTKAVRVKGGWQLSGNKAWISNGGIADLFIVFAQFQTDDGPLFGACAVEKNWPGVSVGAEEHKLGMHSSSTTTVSFDSVFVPEGNLIGSPGNGARIAFGTLNSGRIKVGAISVGVCRELFRHSFTYAKERSAFGRPIVKLAAVREKLAVIAARTFSLEAAVYRMATAIDRNIENGATRHHALADRQAEVALIKVLGSEILAYCADEAIQIHGGNGYSEEYMPARAYRDARVQRIYEGTNEINRNLAIRELLKRWPQDFSITKSCNHDTIPLKHVSYAVMAALANSPTEMDEAVLSPIADIMIAILESESALLRAFHTSHRTNFMALAKLAIIEAQRSALDACMRLPPRIKMSAEQEISELYQKLSKQDRDAAIMNTAAAFNDPVFA